jgi:multiple sugar transport system substrate-binding protein
MSVRLSGVTWDHARAHPPLERTAAAFAAETGVEITWEVRSLYDFGMQPLGSLAREHDLLVIDHPHAGEAAEAGNLRALDDLLAARELAELAQQSVGASHASYRHDGRQWALALDAAAQVSAWRPDLLAAPPATWDETVALAAEGRVLFPAGPTDAFASFLTLAANRGSACGATPDVLLEREDGLAVLDLLLSLTRRIDPACLDLNPIDVLERMAHPGARAAFCPLLFGYTNYARTGFRPRRLRFGGFARVAADDPSGSLLGGAGLAISAHSPHPEEAAAYAAWTCRAAAQRGPYLEAGGQPGNRVAWEDPTADALVGGFFSSTRETMERAWVRPRHPGWLTVQDTGMRVVHAFLAGELPADAALDALDRGWQENQP